MRFAPEKPFLQKGPEGYLLGEFPFALMDLPGVDPMADHLTWRETEVDGVPCVWTDAGEDEDVLCLTFRVGYSDESFVRSGLTHIVEHMALHGIGLQAYFWNGSVDRAFCNFHATGRSEELVEFAAQVCHALRGLPADRLRREQQVLRTEGMARSNSCHQDLLWHRYGARAHGLSGVNEWALCTAKMDDVQAWADTRFTRQNAALWYLGRLPAGLRLPLPEGERWPLAECEPITPLPLPSCVFSGDRTVAVGLICQRSFAITAARTLITHELHDRLRQEEGVVRTIEAEYTGLSRDAAQLSLAVPVLPEHTVTVGSVLLEVLHRMSREGPDERRLGMMKERFRRDWTARWSAASLLDGWVRRSLSGHAPEKVEQSLAEVEALTPEAIAAAVKEALPSAILMLPPGTHPPGEPFLDYPARSEREIPAGNTYFPHASAVRDVPLRYRLLPGVLSPPWPRLRISTEGVSLMFAADDHVTVRADACAGYFCGEEGVRTAVGLDGFHVRVQIGHWKNGDLAIRDLDTVFPSRYWIRA